MNLTPITGTASKQEEIDLLNKVAKLFGSGTYVHDFLSEIALGWVEQKIRDDFPPELYEALIHEQGEHSKTLSKLLKCQSELETTRSSLDTISEGYNRLVEEIEALKREHKEDIKSYRDAHEDISSKCDGLVASNTQLHKEVKRLKVMLFDLEHPSKCALLGSELPEEEDDDYGYAQQGKSFD